MIRFAVIEKLFKLPFSHFKIFFTYTWCPSFSAQHPTTTRTLFEVDIWQFLKNFTFSVRWTKLTFTKYWKIGIWWFYRCIEHKYRSLFSIFSTGKRDLKFRHLSQISFFLRTANVKIFGKKLKYFRNDATRSICVDNKLPFISDIKFKNAKLQRLFHWTKKIILIIRMCTKKNRDTLHN